MPGTDIKKVRPVVVVYTERWITEYDWERSDGQPRNQQEPTHVSIHCLPVGYLPGGEHFVDLRLQESWRCMDIQTAPFDSRAGQE